MKLIGQRVNSSPGKKCGLTLGAVLALAILALQCGGGSSDSGGGGGGTPLNVSISPSSATVNVGGTQQFNASVTGGNPALGAPISIAWAVNSVTGGNSTVGTISTQGLYTAPSVLPSPSTVTVKATATQGSESASASASVSVIQPVPPISMKSVTVTAGQTTSGVDVGLKQITPTLTLIALGTGNSASVTAVTVKQGATSNLFIVGTGVKPGTFYEITGPKDIQITQPSAADFCTTTDGSPCVNVNISVSSTAALGARNLLVENPAGEFSVFVGGLVVTQGP